MSIYSSSKALWHVDRIRQLQENKPISPTLLQVDLEAYCNDNCEFCSYRKDNAYNNEMLKLIDAVPNNKYFEFKPIGRMTKESGLPESMAYDLPKQMKEAGIPAIELTGGGEPTIWKYFDMLLDNLIKEGIEIGLVTNGSTLTSKRIESLGKEAVWVRFSMDSSNGELHHKIHRTPNYDFDRRVDNIRKLIEKKKEYNSQTTIGISFIITPDNQDDIIKSAIFYRKLGVDNIRFSWMYDKEGKAGLNDIQVDEIKTQLNSIKKVMNEDGFEVLSEDGRLDLYSKPNDDFNCCYMQRFVWALGADMKIYPCCIVKYWPNMSLGSLKENTLKELIEKSHQKMNDLDVKQCPPCWLRNRNKAISQAVEKPPHNNFI